MSQGLLSQLLALYVDALTLGMANLSGETHFLLRLFIGIEIATAGALWFWAQEQLVTALTFKIVRIGLFAMFVLQWPLLMTTLLDTMVWVGARTSGGVMSVEQFRNPSELFSLGFRATDPLFAWMRYVGSSWYGFASNVVDILMFTFAALFIWLAFLLMALHVLIAQVMYYLGGAFVLIFIPFGVYTGTTFLAERAIGSVIATSVRIGLMAAVVGLAFPMISGFQLPNPAVAGIDPTMRQAFVFTGGAVGVFCLAWVIPAWAASVFEGGAVLTGQGLITGVARPAMAIVLRGTDLVEKGNSALLKKAA